MNRAVSLRSTKGKNDTSVAQKASQSHRFTFGSLRGNLQTNLSKRLYKLIKTENGVIAVSSMVSSVHLTVGIRICSQGAAECRWTTLHLGGGDK
jgi:hypothetical protein